MRRLWMSALLAPVVALAIPVAASAAPSAPSAPAAATASVHTSQPAGMTRAQVRTLQRRLAALKYYAGPVTGMWGIDGPRATWPGFDQLGQASCGLEHELGGEGNPPVWYRFGMCDQACACQSAGSTSNAQVLMRLLMGTGAMMEKTTARTCIAAEMAVRCHAVPFR